MLLYPHNIPRNTIINMYSKLCFLHPFIFSSFISSNNSYNIISPQHHFTIFIPFSVPFLLEIFITRNPWKKVLIHLQKYLICAILIVRVFSIIVLQYAFQTNFSLKL